MKSLAIGRSGWGLLKVGVAVIVSSNTTTVKFAEDREREGGLQGGGAVRPHPTVAAVRGAPTRSQ